MALVCVGETPLAKAGAELKLDSPRLSELRIAIDGLDISNDLLNAARGLIEEAVNHELRSNEDRVREMANLSIARGMKSRQFQHPLLQLLSLP